MLDNVSSDLLAKLASDVSDLKCDFIAINDEADVQDFYENGYEVWTANRHQWWWRIGSVFDQSEFQSMYIDIGGGDDDSVEAALGLKPVSTALVATW